MRKNEVRLSFKEAWKTSLHELKSAKSVAFCGVMCALGVVLNFVATVNFGPYIRVGFSGLPNQAVDYLLGPTVGVIFASAMDVIKFLLRPSGIYFPGYTLSAALGAAIYALAFYRQPVTLSRVTLAQVLVKVFVNIGCNTYWHAVLFKEAWIVLLPPRLIANVVSLPIDIAITYFMLKLISKRLSYKSDDQRLR